MEYRLTFAKLTKFPLLLIFLAYSLPQVSAITNLSTVIWVSGVNSQDKFDKQLTSSSQLIDGDVTIGTLTGEEGKTIIMCDPPKNVSDLRMVNFLKHTYDHNKENPSKTKDMKLSFTDADAVKHVIAKIEYIDKKWPNEIWFHGNIVQGPMGDNQEAINASVFLTQVVKFGKVALSLGWTTAPGTSQSNKVGYTQNQTDQMKEYIRKFNVAGKRLKIAFSLRAGPAAFSRDTMDDLVKSFEETNEIKFFVWSKKGDLVNEERLRRFLQAIGTHNVYLDLAEPLKDATDRPVQTWPDRPVWTEPDRPVEKETEATVANKGVLRVLKLSLIVLAARDGCLVLGEL